MSWLRGLGVVAGLSLLFAACGDSSRRRHGGGDDEGGAAGEGGSTSAGRSTVAGGSAGNAGNSGSASGAVGGGAGESDGQGGRSANAGSAGIPAGSGPGGEGSGGTGAAGGSLGMAQCADVDCSGHGQCVETVDGPRCDCDAGHAPRALECVSCPQASGTYDIDVPMVQVSGGLTVNGEPAPDSAALLALRGENGDSVALSDLGFGFYSVSVVPGTYDVVYSAQAPDDVSPANVAATILAGVTIDATSTLNIDIPMVTVTGNITVNGEPIATLENAFIQFTGEPNDVLVAGNLTSPTYRTRLVPGTYHVGYNSLQAYGDETPGNQGATLLESVTITEDGTLDIDVPMVRAQGNVTINGETPASGTGIQLTFVNEQGLVPASDPTGLTFSVPMVPGTYDVVYSATSAEPGIPSNLLTTILENVTIEENRSFDIDIPMVAISGSISVNGAPLVPSAETRLYFANATDFIPVVPNGDAYAVSLIPGSYDVVYSTQAGDDGMPDNQLARVLEGVTLDSNRSFDIDIPMATVSGNVTINGRAPVTTGEGNFYFVNDAGDTVIGANLAAPTYLAELVPGTYDVVFAAHTVAASMPANQAAPVLRDVRIDADRTVDLDVATVSIAGNVTLNGAAAALDGIAAIHLVKDENDAALVAYLNMPTYAAEIIPGTYNLLYEARDSNPTIPGNIRGVFACVQIE